MQCLMEKAKMYLNTICTSESPKCGCENKLLLFNF